jgi:hypothetical protein
MAREVEVIWVKREPKYFCEEDWTTQISLIRQQNFFSARTRRNPIAALNAALKHVTLIRGASVPIGSERRLRFFI